MYWLILNSWIECSQNLFSHNSFQNQLRPNFIARILLQFFHKGRIIKTLICSQRLYNNRYQYVTWSINNSLQLSMCYKISITTKNKLPTQSNHTKKIYTLILLVMWRVMKKLIIKLTVSPSIKSHEEKPFCLRQLNIWQPHLLKRHSALQ